jgi:hypothetical protein
MAETEGASRQIFYNNRNMLDLRHLDYPPIYHPLSHVAEQR